MEACVRNADDGGLQNGRHRFLANVYPVWLTNINVNTNRERWRGHWERWPRPSAVRRQATTRGGSLSCRKINNGRCHPKSLAAVGTKILGVQSTTGQMAVLIVVSQPTLLSLFRYQQPVQHLFGHQLAAVGWWCGEGRQRAPTTQLLPVISDGTEMRGFDAVGR